MAIYHLTMSAISRARGASSVASLAYITGLKFYDEREKCMRSYGRRERVMHTETILPQNAPPEYADPAALFNAAERVEKTSDACPAKKIEIALPRELTLDQQKMLLDAFIRDTLTAKNYCCTYAIHSDAAGKNPHAHLLIPTRALERDGSWARVKQQKTYALDENGARIPIIDPETGHQKIGARGRKLWQRVTVSENAIDTKNFLLDARASWADYANAALRAAGHAARIDHRSYEARGLATLPTIHEGHAAREMEARGEISQRCAFNRRARAINGERAAIVAERARLAGRQREIEAELSLSQTASPAPVPSPVPERREQIAIPASLASTEDGRKRQKKLLRYLVGRELARASKGSTVPPAARKLVLARYGRAMQALGMDSKKVLQNAEKEFRMRSSGAWTRPHTPGWPDVLSKLPPKLVEGDPLPPHLPPGALDSVEHVEGDAALMDNMKRDAIRHQRSVRGEL